MKSLYKFPSCFDTLSQTRTKYIFIVFALIAGAGISCHECWRDEWQAVNLAIGIRNFEELRWITRTEGHPPLWYLIIKLCWFVYPGIASVKIVHLAISLFAAYLLLFRIQGDTVYRILFLFGYFFLFEFTVISRNYNLSILGALLAMIGWQKTNAYSLPLLISGLFIMAMSSLYGYLLSIGFFCFFFINISEDVSRKRSKNLWCFALILFLVFDTALLFYFLKPSDNSSVPVNLELYVSIFKLLPKGLATIWNSMLPIPAFTGKPWNSNFLDSLTTFMSPLSGKSSQKEITTYRIYIYLLKSILVLPLLWLLFRDTLNKKLIIPLCLTWACFYAVQTMIYYGSLRHHGYYFISFFLLTLLSQTPRRNSMLTMLLSIQCIVGFVFICMEIEYPFSNDASIAALIEDKKAPVVIDNEMYAPAVAGYLGHAVYLPGHPHEEKVVQWSFEGPAIHPSLQVISKLREVQKFTQISKGYLVFTASDSILNCLPVQSLQKDFIIHQLPPSLSGENMFLLEQKH